MAHTCKLFTPEECLEIFDKANKIGWNLDETKRFSVINLNQEDEHDLIKAYTSYIYPKLNQSTQYSSLVVPKKTSIPLVYSSNSEESGAEWTYHRDDYESEDMKREYTVILSLSDPDDYESGEMYVRDSGTESTYKLPAGYAVVMPSTNYVKFAGVEKGTRKMCRWTIETYIKDPEMFDINLQYNQLYLAFQDNLSKQADEIFSLTNNMLLNKIADFTS